MKKLLCILLFTLLLLPSCYAETGIDDVENAVPDEVRELTGDIDEVGDTDSFFGRLAETAKDAVLKNGKEILKKAVCVLFVALVCGVLRVFSDNGMPDYISLCGCAAISLLCVSDADSYISAAGEAINSISVFSKTLLPALCTLTAATGQVSSAAVRYAASALCMDLFISLAEKLVLPIIYVYLALSIAASAFDNRVLESIAGLVKWLCKTAMTVFAAGFTLYIGLSSVISASGDAVAVKAAKTVISTTLPVIGSIVSDAAASVVAGAELMKTTVGAFGMIAVLSICASPLIVLGLNYLCFKAASAMVSSLGTPQLTKLTGSLGTAFGMLVGLVGCCGLIVFISVISCMRAVVA